MKAFRNLLVASSLALATLLGASPTAAQGLEATSSHLAGCVLDPGVYAITDPLTNQLVGVLIVYDDCTTEIIPVDNQ